MQLFVHRFNFAAYNVVPVRGPNAFLSPLCFHPPGDRLLEHSSDGACQHLRVVDRHDNASSCRANEVATTGIVRYHDRRPGQERFERNEPEDFVL